MLMVELLDNTGYFRLTFLFMVTVVKQSCVPIFADLVVIPVEVYLPAAC